MSRRTKERALRARLAAANKPVAAPAPTATIELKKPCNKPAIDEVAEAEKRRKAKIATKSFRDGGALPHLHANADDHHQRFVRGHAKAHFEPGTNIAAFLPKTTNDEDLIDACDYVADLNPASVEDSLIEAIDVARENEGPSRLSSVVDEAYSVDNYGASPGWDLKDYPRQTKSRLPSRKASKKNGYVRKTRATKTRGGAIITTRLDESRRLRGVTPHLSKKTRRKYLVTVENGTIVNVLAHVRRTLNLGNSPMFDPMAKSTAQQHAYAA